MRGIKKMLAGEEFRRVGKNVVSLSVLQAANYLLPIITLPYLTRVLGVERFGLTAFAQGVTAYLIMFTDFGFNLSATKTISINREDREKTSRIFFSVLSVKVLLYALSVLFVFLLISFVPLFAAEREIYLVSLAGVFGLVVFPQWFFQGVEQMWIITAVNLVVKTVTTACVFIFIHSPKDYLLVPAFVSAGYLAAGLLSLSLAFARFGVRLRLPSIRDIIDQFTDGWHIFVSSVAINLYTTGNVVMLGFFTNNITVGIYSAAEKVFRAFQFLAMPVYQALFPQFSKMIAENKKLAVRRFEKIFGLTLLLSAAVAVLLYAFSSPLISLIIGKGYEKSADYLRLLAFIIFFAWGNYHLGILGLVNFGHEKKFSVIVVAFGILHILLLLPGIHFFGSLAVPAVWLFTEACIFASCYYGLYKEGIVRWNS